MLFSFFCERRFITVVDDALACCRVFAFMGAFTESQLAFLACASGPAKAALEKNYAAQHQMKNAAAAVPGSAGCKGRGKASGKNSFSQRPFGPAACGSAKTRCSFPGGARQRRATECTANVANSLAAA